MVYFLVFGTAGLLFYFWWLQHAKDAPFVSVDTRVVGRVMKIAEIDKNDVFYDLGSGDGRLVIAAAIKGARTYGVESDWLRVIYSRFWLQLPLGLRIGNL